MPRLRRRGVVGEVVEEKKDVSPEVEVPSASSSAGTTATAARTAKGPTSKAKTVTSSSENKMEATTPTGVVKKKPPSPPQAQVGKGRIQKSFRDRLQWRSTHCAMPPTSTPIRNPREKFTKQDIETAFGFDEEVEKIEYSTLVSPIAHASPKGIIAPVWKIHPLSQRNVELGVPKSRNPQLPAGPSSRTRHPPQKRSSSEEAKGSPRAKVNRRPALEAPVSPKSQPEIPPTPPEAVHDKKTLELEVTAKPIMGDIELPSTIEVTPPVSSLSPSVVPSSSSEPLQSKANEPAVVEVLIEKPKEKEVQAPSATVPLRRGRSKKKVDYSEEKSDVDEVEAPVLKSKPAATRSRKTRRASPVTEEQKSNEDELVPEPTKKTTRSTRSQKAAGGTAALPETALKLKNALEKKLTSKLRKPEVEVLEIEADDEKEEHEVVLEAAPVAKRKRAPEEAKSRRKVKSRTTKTAASTFAPEKRPLLFENVAKQEDQVTGISPFSQLVSRYKEDEMEDGELRVDPRKIVRTYTSRKRAKFSEERDSEAEYDFIPKPTKSSALTEEDDMKIKKKTKKGVKVKGKKKKAGEDDLDEETRKWLEQKNKEFDDVAKVKLVIEQSFSD